MCKNLLILLIGSNPLPNYVVASYLLNPRRQDKDTLPMIDKIMFVVSEETLSFAKNIKALLENQYSFSDFVFANLNKKHRESSVIRDEILTKLCELPDEISTIHLNYTGGTKPMAVFAHQTILSFAKDKKNTLITSDLMPETFKLNTEIIRPESEDCIEVGNSKIFPEYGDLREYVEIGIEELLKLHNMAITSAGDVMTSETIEQTGKWMNKNFWIFDDLKKAFAIDELRGKDSDKENSLKNKNIYENGLKSFFKLMKNGNDLKLRIFNDYFKSGGGSYWLEEKNGDYYLRKSLLNVNYPALSFVEFICGKWLEEYVLKAILDCGKSISFSLVRKNVKVNKDNREAEFDVILMKGYQLFLISCSTDSKIQRIKHKAFEALYRAEQIGGEHAQVIMVSMLPNDCNKNDAARKNNINELKKDISQFNARQKISYVGLEDLEIIALLQSKLKSILK